MTKEEIQKMIDDAILKHNIQATLISAVLGSIVLAFYVHGLLTIVNKITS